MVVKGGCGSGSNCGSTRAENTASEPAVENVSLATIPVIARLGPLPMPLASGADFDLPLTCCPPRPWPASFDADLFPDQRRDGMRWICEMCIGGGARHASR